VVSVAKATRGSSRRRLALPVLGMVQDGVDVVKDVPLGDGAVAGADAKLFRRHVHRL
jgi:hypothetical protein